MRPRRGSTALWLAPALALPVLLSLALALTAGCKPCGLNRITAVLADPDPALEAAIRACMPPQQRADAGLPTPPWSSYGGGGACDTVCRRALELVTEAGQRQELHECSVVQTQQGVTEVTMLFEADCR